jgi:hypothetical protein
MGEAGCASARFGWHRPKRQGCEIEFGSAEFAFFNTFKLINLNVLQ